MSVTYEREDVKDGLIERVVIGVFCFVVSPEPPIEEETEGGSGIEICGIECCDLSVCEV